MADPLRKPPADEEPDPFRYGSRRKSVRLSSGEVVEQEVPLTAEDLLDPQPGDEVTQSDPHAQIVTALHELLKRHYESVQDVVVLFDIKIEWGIPGIPNPSPDGPDRRYRRIEPDAQGRLHSETTQLFFAPSEDRRTVRVGDAATGEWLLTGSEEQAARRAAEERARQAEAEIAWLRAELERFKKAGR